MTYRQDVVNFVSATGSGNYTINNTPSTTPVAGGFESIGFDISSPTPIINLDEVLKARFQVMVAKEFTTKFTISDVKFFDSKNVYICYVAADTIPGVFNPNYQCGDSTLHNYLGGILPTTIHMLSPNVLEENETPVLLYRVNQTDVPVRVEIFNVLGERVRLVKNTLTQPVGEYKLPVGTLGLSSGTYTLRLSTPKTTESVNFILHK